MYVAVRSCLVPRETHAVARGAAFDHARGRSRSWLAPSPTGELFPGPSAYASTGDLGNVEFYGYAETSRPP
jgi:hypothetical protein